MLHCETALQFYYGEHDYTVVDLGITNGGLQDSVCEAHDKYFPAMPTPGKCVMHIWYS